MQPNLTRGMHAGKEVSVNMEYNRQVAVGGAVAAEAAKAKGTTADQRDMAFATVTLAEKDNNGQQKSSNVGSVGPMALYTWILQHASLTTCPMSLKTDFMMCCMLPWLHTAAVTVNMQVIVSLASDFCSSSWFRT